MLALSLHEVAKMHFLSKTSIIIGLMHFGINWCLSRQISNILYDILQRNAQFFSKVQKLMLFRPISRFENNQKQT